jgi:hypothetical protein
MGENQSPWISRPKSTKPDGRAGTYRWIATSIRLKGLSIGLMLSLWCRGPLKEMRAFADTKREPAFAGSPREKQCSEGQ